MISIICDSSRAIGDDSDIVCALSKILDLIHEKKSSVVDFFIKTYLAFSSALFNPTLSTFLAVYKSNIFQFLCIKNYY